MKSRGEEVKPFAASLLEAVETATLPHDEFSTISVMGGKARRDAHINMFLQSGL